MVSKADYTQHAPKGAFFIKSPMNAKAITIEPLVYTKAQLPAVIGLGKSAIDNMRRKGQFPHPRQAGRQKKSAGQSKNSRSG